MSGPHRTTFNLRSEGATETVRVTAVPNQKKMTKRMVTLNHIRLKSFLEMVLLIRIVVSRFVQSKMYVELAPHSAWLATHLVWLAQQPHRADLPRFNELDKLTQKQATDLAIKLHDILRDQDLEEQVFSLIQVPWCQNACQFVWADFGTLQSCKSRARAGVPMRGFNPFSGRFSRSPTSPTPLPSSS